MTPEAAVAVLVQIISTRTEFTEDELYAAMADAGIPDAVADRAYKFTQVAWGRVFLDGIGLEVAPDYLCFDGTGEVIEAGVLAEQPYFAAAMIAARRQPPPAGLPRLALMSADVSAVNGALHAGSKAEDLVVGPPALFMEPPTSAGIQRARIVLAKRVAEHKKRWWRFW